MLETLCWAIRQALNCLTPNDVALVYPVLMMRLLSYVSFGSKLPIVI